MLCCAAPSLLVLGWLIPWVAVRDASLILPVRAPDVLLYTTFIQRAAQGFLSGDPFLWEHHQDAASLFSFYHFWPWVYGKLFNLGGHPALLLASMLLSGIWFSAVFSFATRLGQPRPYAFFTAGLQTFFVVNFAYQAFGFKTNFAAYNLSTSEHVRLYPTVTSMALYNMAVLAVAWALPRLTWRTLIPASALVAWTVYGRPFDWMVLLGALALVGALNLLERRPRVAVVAWSLLGLAVLLSLPFVRDFLAFNRLHADAYLDQISRGNLQVKMPGHYLKYAMLCVVVLAGVFWTYRKWGPATPREGEAGTASSGQRNLALGWLVCLVASSLLVHFKTLLEGGVTLVGFTYLMVFSTVPWTFMWGGWFTWRWLSRRWPKFGQSPGWVVVCLALLLLQQTVVGLDRIPSREEADAFRSRRQAWAWLRQHAPAHPVVMTLGSGLEAVSLADAWVYLPNPTVATYVCSAPTVELLDRFLWMKLLLTGTVRDLAPLFDERGLPGVEGWIRAQPETSRAWIQLLRTTLGANTFLLDPCRNRGEIRVRRLDLPPQLASQPGFVAFFSKEMREDYLRIVAVEESQRPVLPLLLRRYRVDYLFIPPSGRALASMPRLDGATGLSRVSLPGSPVINLWRVGGRPGSGSPPEGTTPR